MMDSYYPNYLNPYIYLQLPERASQFLSDTKVQFVGANKL